MCRVSYRADQFSTNDTSDPGSTRVFENSSRFTIQAISLTGDGCSNERDGTGGAGQSVVCGRLSSEVLLPITGDPNRRHVGLEGDGVEHPRLAGPFPQRQN